MILSAISPALIERRSSRPRFPSQPEQKNCEKRNEPAVTVLIVHRPLAAQLPEEDEPQRADENRCCDDGVGESGTERRWSRRCLRGGDLLHE